MGLFWSVVAICLLVVLAMSSSGAANGNPGRDPTSNDAVGEYLRRSREAARIRAARNRPQTDRQRAAAAQAEQARRVNMTSDEHAAYNLRTEQAQQMLQSGFGPSTLRVNQRVWC